MQKARINSFGDLIIDTPEGSVNYPTEFTKVVARSYRKPNQKNRRLSRRYIVGILEVPGGECLLHELQILLRDCVNAHKFTVIPTTHVDRSRRKDLYVNTNGQVFKNRFVPERVDLELPAESFQSNEDRYLQQYESIKEPYYLSLIG